MKVQYSCVCGIKDREVEVPDRDLSQDVKLWVGTIVAAAVTSDHRMMRSWCRADTIKSLKIPYAGQGPIGGPTVH